MSFRPFRIKFQVSIVVTILASVFVMAAAALLVVLVSGNLAAEHNARVLFRTLAKTVEKQTEDRLDDSVALAVLTSRVPTVRAEVQEGATTFGTTLLLQAILAQNDTLYSAYVGKNDGTFLQVIKASGDSRIPQVKKAPSGTQSIVRTITGSPRGRRETWTYLGAGGKPLEVQSEHSVSFDPTLQSWFSGAVGKQDGILSAPYLLSVLGEPGLTASAPLSDGSGVVGIDVSLASLSTYLATMEVSAHGGIEVHDQGALVLARTSGFENQPGNLTAEASATIAGRTVTTVVSAPSSDFESDFRGIQLQVLAAMAVLLGIFLPLAFLVSRRLSDLIRALTLDVERIWKLDFSGRLPKGSRIQEFNLLTAGFSMMKGTLSARTKALSEQTEHLTRSEANLALIVDLANDLSAEKDINRLTELILQGARTLTNADGGSLYLVDKEGRNLVFQIVLNDTLGFKQGGTSGQAVTMPPVPLYKEDGSENRNNVVSTSFLSQEIVNIPDAYDDGRFDFSGTKKFDASNGYRSKSFLTIPLKPRGGNVIGALQLINAKDPTANDPANLGVFTPKMEEYVSALTALAATALYNRDLLEAQKALFEAVIQLIAGAIDTKSPYTGGHCARVPELAMMLADAASRTKEGPLVGFSFKDEDERREFRIAAWLHDAGKVTTPEYVVDKATKLETIYNRIHEVRTRFEVLLRDARIRRLEAILGGSDTAEQDRILAEEEARLQEDFAFLAQANLGAEFIAPDKVARIKSLGQRTWIRHFDDRVGLSWEEMKRSAPDPVRPLPATEQLLSDKAIHIFPRRPEDEEVYAGYGFAIPIPEHLYNQGEVYNLTIGRGTLTTEERFKINEHVMQTIVMLDKLPLPEGLKRVPEFAGQHHETLVGTGYPRMLTGDALSLPSRILTIADIFEALSASDRPYKKPKTLSECIQVLSMFKKDKHIDPDLFDLFLTSGVYKEYSDRFLRPEQQDEVDITQFLG